jgi:hypothetical protein
MLPSVCADARDAAAANVVASINLRVIMVSP